MKTKPITFVVDGKRHALSAQQAHDLATRLTAAAAGRSAHHMATGTTEVVLNTEEAAPRPTATGTPGTSTFAASQAATDSGAVTDC